jgi:endo-1,4-beta-xylanase
MFRVREKTHAQRGGAMTVPRHRTTDATVTVLLDGAPLAHQEVVVQQRSHQFLFGSTGSDFIALANDELTGEARARAERLAEKWLALFNAATLPFYWGSFEGRRGSPDTARMIKAAKWFVDRGCLVKGHPLCWHTVTADWLLSLTNKDIARAQHERIHRDVSDFAGLIDAWDVANEVVIMPIFDKKENGITRMCRELGRIGTIRMTFDAARAANPGAVLLLNDFDVSAAYECLVEGCLEAGIRIDALGIQSHMHQGYWGVQKTQEVIERFARYGLPIHFTESTIVSGRTMPPEIVDLNDYHAKEWPSTPEGEARQAEEVARHYETLFSHPAVEAITWWGLPDGGWLNAPSGLVGRDGSPKPAYDALLDLVARQWWLAPTPMITDGDGKVRYRGFLGEHAVSWSGKSAAFRLDRKDSTVVEARL